MTRPGSAASHPARRLVTACVATMTLAAVVSFVVRPTAAQDMGATPQTGSGTCGLCHEGIEDMHPFSPVTCVQCHGGDDTQAAMEKAHVKRRTRPPGDERVLGRSFDLEYTRFQDPGNLRVAEKSCGPCHEKAVYDTIHSLHSSTSGHLGDGLYENGVVSKRHPPVSIFALRDELPADVPRPETAVKSLKQISGFSSGSNPRRLATHFTDLPRKACMRCHLWGRGRAVRGRAGMDGDYRGEGCSACHVPYADDGLSLSRDKTIKRYEPGHPREHRMVRFPTTQTCTRCHYGDASIGLSFRGLAQPVPGMPQTPDAPGLHRKRLNGVYYIDDPAATPADVHHQRGMHCVDCHTRQDTMGDGFLYKRMEDSVEMQCTVCHGTPDEYATFITRRGNKLAHLSRKGNEVFLKSRVTGKNHRVKQARDVVRPGSSDFNPKAALAMTDDHLRLECYSCHSGWNPNFFGFHFDRNESFTQLDQLSGKRTTGQVSSQEKVFSTFKNYYLGWNSHGKIAPYMVAFSTMATVHDEKGALILDQVLPVTRAGLSGMTMIHHQTHTTTARARSCVECHRAPGTFGRGTVNFRLARDFGFAAALTGVKIFSLNRKSPGDSQLLSSIAVDDPRAIAVRLDPQQGYGETLFAASAKDGLVVCDVTSPGFPKIVGRVRDAMKDPQRMLVAEDRLFVADGAGGLRIFDISDRTRPRQRFHQEQLPAYDLFLDGATLYVAAGRRGLVTIDVRKHFEPVVLNPGFDLNGEDTAPVDARRVEVLFQYSRPNPTTLEGPRSPARNLAAVGATVDGVFLVDVTFPKKPRTLSRVPGVRSPGVNVADLALGTIYELGSEGGAIPTQERDYLFIVGRLGGRFQLILLDVTNPLAPAVKGGVNVSAGVTAVKVVRAYNAPFLQTFAVAVSPLGLQILDASRPDKPVVVANLAVGASGLSGYDVSMEEFPLDRTVDSAGEPIMDVSHEGARWLDQREFLRVMGVPILGLMRPATTRQEMRTGEKK